MQRVTESAYAKINLGLQIAGRRDDGYHDLVTVFQMVGPADEVTVAPSQPGLHTRSTGPFRVRDDDRHLCARAARLYCEATGIQPAFDIFCRKYIPVGAGLGGGSSDAAATLRALERMHGAGVNLEKIGARIGSDVAFFMQGGTALGTGRGEKLLHTPTVHSTPVVLVKPKTGINTHGAYALLTPDDFSDGARTLELFCRLTAGDDPLELIELMGNDFQAPIERAYPELTDVRLSIERAGAARAMLAGSGSCVFGLFAESTAAERCARELSEVGYWTYSTGMLHSMPSAGLRQHRNGAGHTDDG